MDSLVTELLQGGALREDGQQEVPVGHLLHTVSTIAGIWGAVDFVDVVAVAITDYDAAFHPTTSVIVKAGLDHLLLARCRQRAPLEIQPSHGGCPAVVALKARDGQVTQLVTAPWNYLETVMSISGYASMSFLVESRQSRIWFISICVRPIIQVSVPASLLLFVDIKYFFDNKTIWG